MASFGERLRRIREYRRFSMRQLGQLAQVPYETIARLESGAHKSPRFDVAIRLAHALCVSLDYFASQNNDQEDMP